MKCTRGEAALRRRWAGCFTPLEGGKDAEPDESKKKRIYDTTQLGYSNSGHLYGDALTAEERASVIEYLKTL